MRAPTELVTGDDGAGEAHRAHQHRDGRLAFAPGDRLTAAPFGLDVHSVHDLPERVDTLFGPHALGMPVRPPREPPSVPDRPLRIDLQVVVDVEHRPQARVVGDRRPGLRPTVEGGPRRVERSAARRQALFPESLLDQLRGEIPDHAVGVRRKVGSWGWS